MPELSLPDPLAHPRLARPARPPRGRNPNRARPVRHAFGSAAFPISSMLRSFAFNIAVGLPGSAAIPLPRRRPAAPARMSNPLMPLMPLTLRAALRGALLAACLASALAPLAARAQASTPAAPQSIDWEIRVLHDGQTVDTFHQTTTVGQSRTDTHDYPVTLGAACAGKEASIVAAVKPQRSRTVTVAPLYVEGDTVTLQIDAQETLDDGDGCSLAPRQISASHPGLAVHAESWTDWAPADKKARLLYQVRAHVVQG